MQNLETVIPFSNVVKIYVPGTIDENKPAPELQAAKTVETVKFMCGLFGGATVGTFTGYWINDTGDMIAEPQNIVSSFFEDSEDKDEKIDAFLSYSRQL